MTYTFRGGVRLDEHKHTDRCESEDITPPARLSIPMSQHIGAPCTVLVKKGDRVLVGQKIGDAEKGLACPVHSSVSGTVVDIEERSTPSGSRSKFVIIENDFENEVSPEVKPFAKRLTDADSDELIAIIKNAGIAGMGGAGFPTHAKISSAMGKVSQILVNCAECEPFITANHRLLLEDPTSVINGIKIIQRILGVRDVTVCVEDNKMDAVNVLEELLGDNSLIRVAVMKTKYPQGDERQLIYAITGQELKQGQLPADAGCVIFNAETCSAIFNAFNTGMPLIKRRVTVDGDCVAEPKNLIVPIGTPYSDLIEYCGGLKKTPKKIVSGGPMMGMAQWETDAPVVKGTSAILVLSADFDKRNVSNGTCIRCGRCVAHCPMHLMPIYLAMFAMNGDMDLCDKYGVMSCVECGTCSYGCPGNVPIVQQIRVAKGELRALAAAKKVAAAKSEAKGEIKAEAKSEEKPEAKSGAENAAKAEKDTSAKKEGK